MFDELGRDTLRKTDSFAFLVEDVKTAAVDDEVKRRAGRRDREKVDDLKPAQAVRLAPRPIHGDFREVDTQHIEVMLSEKDRVRPSAAADFERPSWRDRTRLDHLDEQWVGCPVSQGNGSPEA